MTLRATYRAETDTEEHMSSRQSYRARQYHRLAKSFETVAEATERARKTPPKAKETTCSSNRQNHWGPRSATDRQAQSLGLMVQ